MHVQQQRRRHLCYNSLKHFPWTTFAGLQVAVDGPQSTPVQAGAVRAGVCSFSYHAHAAGTYTVTATVYGANVCNSPAVVVASIAKACPSQCEVKGCPLTLSLVWALIMQMLCVPA